ncbi:hypothetical protein PAMA_003496 [Pampus argenteus]
MPDPMVSDHKQLMCSWMLFDVVCSSPQCQRLMIKDMNLCGADEAGSPEQIVEVAECARTQIDVFTTAKLAVTYTLALDTRQLLNAGVASYLKGEVCGICGQKKGIGNKTAFPSTTQWIEPVCTCNVMQMIHKSEVSSVCNNVIPHRINLSGLPAESIACAAAVSEPDHNL